MAHGLDRDRLPLPAMNQYPLPARPAQRTPLSRGRLRRAIFDTSVLTTDVIAATRRAEPSSFEAGMRGGTVRGFIPEAMASEVPRVLADRHREGGRFDLVAALRVWEDRYAPLLYVVRTDGLPLTDEARVLALEDPSDVALLQLAGVVARWC
jgi:hypothetical protein